MPSTTSNTNNYARSCKHSLTPAHTLHDAHTHTPTPTHKYTRAASAAAKSPTWKAAQNRTLAVQWLAKIVGHVYGVD